MARPQRILFPDACYLVSLQGADGLGLFVEPADAAHFVELLDLTARKHQVLIHAYALAENSAQLVLQTPDANLSAYMQGLQTAYARYIRHHYVQKGAIIQGRYHAKVLDASTLLATACEWVHSFPARDKESVKTPAQKKKFLESYSFSSLRYTADKVETGITDPTALLRTYGSPAKKRPQKHLEATQAMAVEGNLKWKALLSVSPVAIGSEEFVNDITRKHQALKSGKRVKGLKVFGKKARGVARNTILAETVKTFRVEKNAFFEHRHNSMLRPALAHLLYRFSAMTQKEIAAYIGVTSSAAVSLQIRRLLQARETDAKLDKSLKQLEKRFSER